MRVLLQLQQVLQRTCILQQHPPHAGLSRSPSLRSQLPHPRLASLAQLRPPRAPAPPAPPQSNRDRPPPGGSRPADPPQIDARRIEALQIEVAAEEHDPPAADTYSSSSNAHACSSSTPSLAGGQPPRPPCYPPAPHLLAHLRLVSSPKVEHGVRQSVPSGQSRGVAGGVGVRRRPAT
jgi:hypothetical protein